MNFKKVYFVGGIRGAGKDYAVSRIEDIVKLNFFNDILKPELDESWKKTELNIGGRIKQLAEKYRQVIILLHYAGPIESIYSDLQENITRDFSHQYKPSISNAMAVSMLSNDTHFNLIHIDSPTEEIVKRLEGDTQKKRSKGYIENIDYVRKEDKIAFEEIKSNFLNLGFNLSHFYLFNSRDADIRRELETIVTEDEADKR